MKRAPAPRPEWIETCAIEHASGNVIDFPMVHDSRRCSGWSISAASTSTSGTRAATTSTGRTTCTSTSIRSPGATFERRARDGAARARGTRGARRCRRYVKTTGSKGHARLCADRARARCRSEVWGFAKRWRGASRGGIPELITAEYRIAKRPGRPRAGRLQPERVGADAGVGLLAAAAARRDGFDAGDLGGGGARWREDRGLPDRQLPARSGGTGDLWPPLRAPQAGPFRPRAAARDGALMTLPIGRRLSRRWRQARRRAAARVTEWQYEPKWDGFRCLAFRDGDEVDLRRSRDSRSAATFRRSSTRCARCRRSAFVLDGELVIAGGRGAVVRRTAAADPSGREPRAQARPRSIRRRLRRLRPAGGRARALARRRAARGPPRSARALCRALPRCARVPAVAGHAIAAARPSVAGDAGRQGSTASSRSASTARIARASAPACRRYKDLRTADCVVGGFRYGAKARWSDRCCSASTTTRDSSTTSASRRTFRATNAKRLPEARVAERQAGIHRARAGRTESLEHGTQRRVGAAAPEARRRGALRPFQRRPLSARHELPALATRQGAASVYVRASQFEANGFRRAPRTLTAYKPRAAPEPPPSRCAAVTCVAQRES